MATAASGRYTPKSNGFAKEIKTEPIDEPFPDEQIKSKQPLFAPRVNGKENGHAVSVVRNEVRKRVPRKTSTVGWVFSNATRAAITFLVFTIAFRCPSTPEELTASSPSVCKPYFDVKHEVLIYTKPVYDEYLAHHVDRYTPYYDSVVTPAVKFGKETYSNYGSPLFQQAQDVGFKQYDALLRPHITSTSNLIQAQYASAIQPHVNKVLSAVMPHYNTGRDAISKVASQHLYPAYASALPYAQQAYLTGQTTFNQQISPAVIATWKTSYHFLDRQILPRLRILYGQNIEPQLTRISERLGRYRDGRKLKAEVEALSEEMVASTIAEPVIVEDMPTVEVAVEESATPIVEEPTQPQPEFITEETTAVDEPAIVAEQAERPVKIDEEPPKEDLRTVIDSDLKAWYEKFELASAQGSKDLFERIDEIAARQKRAQLQGVGESLIIQLEESITSELESLQSRIISVVSSLPDSSDNEAADSKAEEQISTSIRKAGTPIRKSAQAIRSWRATFDSELTSLIDAAATSTGNVIESIGDAALQELGLRWSFMEALSYKDWQRYHATKESYGPRKQNIGKAAREHSAYIALLKEAEELENRGMDIAEQAAKELARLKTVGGQKVKARDVSDDFEVKESIPEKVKSVFNDVVESVAEYLPLSSATDSASEVVEEATSVVGESASSVSDAVTEQVTKVLSVIRNPEIDLGVDTDSLSSTAESVLSSESSVADNAVSSGSSIVDEVYSTGSSVVDQASESVIGSSTPVYESLASQASEQFFGSETPVYASMASHVSEGASSVYEDVSSSVSSYAEPAGSSVDEAVSSASSYVEDVTPTAESIIGEATGSIESVASSASEYIEPIVEEASCSLDDTTSTISESGSSIADSMVYSASSLSSTGSKASRRLSSSIFASAQAFKPSSSGPILDDVEDTVSSAVSVASSYLDMAASAVNEAIGRVTSTQNVGDKIASVGSEQYSAAMAAASSALYGAKKGPQDVLADEIKSRYSDAVKAASSVYYSNLPSVSVAVSSQLDGAASVLSSQYGSFSAAASSYFAPAPTGYYASISNMANAQLAMGLSVASRQYTEALKSASELAASAQSVGGDALSSASSAANDMASSASSIGTDIAYSAQSLVGATPTPAYIVAQNEAKRRYYEGVGMAHDAYSQFMGQASSALGYTQTGYFEGASSSVVSYATDAAGSMQSAGSDFSRSVSSVYSVASRSGESVVGEVSRSVSSAYSVASKSGESVARDVSKSVSSAYSVASKSGESVASSISSLVAPHASAASKSADSMVSEISSSGSSIASVVSEGASPYVSAVSSNVENFASAASENWDALINQISVQVYGTPKPYAEVAYSSAQSYAAQASNSAATLGSQASAAAAEQYAGMQSMLVDLLAGMDTTFSQDLLAKLSSAYHTDLPSASASVSSYASVVVDQVTGIFTAPPSFETILADVQGQIDAAVSSASVQIYGHPKGSYASVSARASSAADSAASKVSVAIYGSQTGYYEDATSRFNEAASSASSALSIAIYGTPTPVAGSISSVTSVVNDAYSSVAAQAASVYSDAADQVGSAYAQVSQGASGMYSDAVNTLGDAKGRDEALKNAQKSIADAMESAQAKVREMIELAGEAVKSVTSSKDEL